jgi:hypothetical protein
MRSIAAEESLREKIPWSDVMSRGPSLELRGEQYLLSYHCTSLTIPKLEPFKDLTAASFSRALMKCLLRTRVIPDIVRSDRGPEMTSAINEELLALLGVKHMLGAAFTPRHQGAGERTHQIIMNNHLLLMNEVCKAFPQEWATLVPALEYLCESAARASRALGLRHYAGMRSTSGAIQAIGTVVLPDGVAETEVVGGEVIQNISQTVWRLHEGHSRRGS